MNLNTFFFINFIVAVLFGLCFIFVPATMSDMYDAGLGEGGLFVGQLFGATLLAIAFITLFARNVTDSTARKAITLGLFIHEVVALVIAIIGQLAGVVNSLGWSTVAIYAIFALGYGYFRFIKPD